MSTTTTRTDHRTAAQRLADDEIASRHEASIVVDPDTGWTLHAATDARRQATVSLQGSANNAVLPAVLDVPLLWQGKAYRITKAAYQDGQASVEVFPADERLVSVLKDKIETERHHVLTFYHGFGFVCLPDDYTKYRDC